MLNTLSFTPGAVAPAVPATLLAALLAISVYEVAGAADVDSSAFEAVVSSVMGSGFVSSGPDILKDLVGIRSRDRS